MNYFSLIHGSSLVLAMIIGGFFSYFLSKKDKNKLRNLDTVLLLVFLFGVIGARLSYFFVYHDQFKSFVELFKIWDGGLISYGGFLAGALALILTLKIQRQNLSLWLDYLSPGFLLGVLIGRLGDHFSGEQAGYFHGIPVTVLEALLALLVFCMLLILWPWVKKIILLPFVLTLALYSVGRFFIDFARDEVHSYGIFSLGQFVSIAIFLLAIFLVFLVIQSDWKEKNGLR